jgi:hypothetical protein
MRRLSGSEKAELWDRFESGESLRSISRSVPIHLVDEFRQPSRTSRRSPTGSSSPTTDDATGSTGGSDHR